MSTTILCACVFPDSIIIVQLIKLIKLCFFGLILYDKILFEENTILVTCIIHLLEGYAKR